MSPNSNSSKDTSHFVTSHSIPLKIEPKNITFGYMHPEASTNEGNKSAKADLHTHRLTSSQSNGQGRTSSYKKYMYFKATFMMTLFFLVDYWTYTYFYFWIANNIYLFWHGWIIFGSHKCIYGVIIYLGVDECAFILWYKTYDKFMEIQGDIEKLKQ